MYWSRVGGLEAGGWRIIRKRCRVLQRTELQAGRRRRLQWWNKEKVARIAVHQPCSVAVGRYLFLGADTGFGGFFPSLSPPSLRLRSWCLFGGRSCFGFGEGGTGFVVIDGGEQGESCGRPRSLTLSGREFRVTL